MLLGSHVSLGGKEMLLQAAKEAAVYQANALLCYTGAPQNSHRKPIEDYHISEAWDYMKLKGIQNVTIHGPFLINLANSIDPHVFSFSIDFLKEELQRTEAIGAKTLVLHPGAHRGAGSEKGIAQLIEGLNEVLDHSAGPSIALETMAGKGTEIGKNFAELAEIISGVTYNERLSVCVDTCHIYDGGYDIVNDLDSVLKEFDQLIGLERISTFHLNDSLYGLASHKDRHQNIGLGKIGLPTLKRIVDLPEFAEVPKFLETPSNGKVKYKNPPYKEEIALLRGELSFEEYLKSPKLYRER
ncbi:deoxyribonuclease IV [Enterococcus sp. DIV0788_1]